MQVRDVRGDDAWQRHIVLETQARLSEVMMTLNFSDYLNPYPAVTVQIANLGGTIPFLLERMDEVTRERPGVPLFLDEALALLRRYGLVWRASDRACSSVFRCRSHRARD